MPEMSTYRVRFAWPLVITLTAALTAVTGAPAAQANDLLELIPADVAAVMYTPGLRVLNDEFTQLLDGMDQGQLLMGARPIDHLKGVLGVSVALDESRGAALLILPGEEAGHYRPAVLVPVTDADDFLRGNFRAVDENPTGDDERLRTARWRDLTLHARVLDRYVLLSPSREAVRDYAAGGGAGSVLTDRFGERGRAIRRDSEIVLYARGGDFDVIGARLVCQVNAALQPMREAGLPAALPVMWPMGQIDAVLAGVDLDPLGVFARSMVVLHEGGELARAMRGAPQSGVRFEGLPDAPFMLTGSVDVAGMGGEAAAEAVRDVPLLGPVMRLLAGFDGLRFSVPEIPPQPARGVVTRGVVIAETDDPPEAMLASIERMQSLLSARGQLTHEEREVEGAHAAVAYEINLDLKTPPLPMLRQIIFGPAKWRGYLLGLERTMLVTYMREREVVERAIDDARRGASTLDEQPVIRSMRGFLPGERFIELYFNPGRLSGAVRPRLQPLVQQAGLRWPGISPNEPPIAFGASRRAETVEMTLIIPAGVLAPVADLLRDTAMTRGINRQGDRRGGAGQEGGAR